MGLIVLKRPSDGFTLIEILVVLVLLGLISSIALTTVGGGNQSRELKNEVNRLHAVLLLAAEEAIYSNDEIGVVIEEDLYEFLVYDEEKKNWQGSDKHALRSYTLPEWISLDFQREGKERKILGSDKDDNNDLTAELSDDVFDAAQSSKVPQFMLLSSGEVTGFIIGMQIQDDHDSRIEIKTNEQGEIIIPSRQDQDA
jgi:general secretion pathway protein H